MKVADAHCDTLVKFKDNPFYTEEAKWNYEDFKNANGVLQYMAVFTSEDYAGDSALAFAANAIGRFHGKRNDDINLIEKHDDYDENKINILLTLEGGSPIINDIYNLDAFYKLGVRLMTLTWNHRNYIGDGVQNNYGLTEFGREVVKRMEYLGMIVDVSHLSYKGFDDVVKTAKKPFMASHSNVYKLCNHPRNLKDYQIKEIIDREGFIGINFWNTFISDRDDVDMKYFILKHFDYILDMGGENVLGLGADYDGMDIAPFDNVREYKILRKLLKEELLLSDDITDKIMYKNLVDFTKKMI